MKKNEPYVVDGGMFEDERGKVRFVNDFKFEDVKRFYVIENQNKNFLRAWQGHKVETKCFYAVRGTFLICTVKPDDWEKPSKDLKVDAWRLDSAKSQVLVVPGGYANGIKCLSEDNVLVVFSDMEVEESRDDDYRFAEEKWSTDCTDGHE